MNALAVCLLIVLPLAWVFFKLGRAWEQTKPPMVLYMLPRTSERRHPSQHHRPARHERTVHDRQRPTLRLVTPIFDFEENEPA